MVKTHNGVQRGDEPDCFIIRRDRLLACSWYGVTDYLDLLRHFMLTITVSRFAPSTLKVIASIFSKNSYYQANMELLNPTCQQMTLLPQSAY